MSLSSVTPLKKRIKEIVVSKEEATPYKTCAQGAEQSKLFKLIFLLNEILEPDEISGIKVKKTKTAEKRVKKQKSTVKSKSKRKDSLSAKKNAVVKKKVSTNANKNTVKTNGIS